MLSGVFEWLAKVLLEFLFKKATAAVEDAAAQAALDKQRGITNAENVAKYEAAKTRAEEIAAASDLLNGTRSSLN